MRDMLGTASVEIRVEWKYSKQSMKQKEEKGQARNKKEKSIYSTLWFYVCVCVLAVPWDAQFDRSNIQEAHKIQAKVVMVF